MSHQKSISPISISRTHIIIGLICVAAIFLSIRFFMGKTTSFYQNTNSWDANYIPLIEPYKATRFSDDPASWSVDLVVGLNETKGLYYFQITDIEKIAVENNLIMLYTSYSRSLTEEEKGIGLRVLHWFVIIPSQKIETGFETEDEFLTYIHKSGIERPIWIKTDVAYQQFLKTRCLNWITNCK